MRQFNKFKGTKGFISMWERVIRFRYMITEEAKERTRILAFWERHGTEASCEAFKVSRRTLFRWQEALEKGYGKLESLNPQSTAPKRKRKREIQDGVLDRIILIRAKHPRLGKDKVRSLLAQGGYKGSVSTVGRIIESLKKSGRIPKRTLLSFNGRTGRLFNHQEQSKRKKFRRPKGYRVLEIDTVVRFVDGIKRYVLTGTDTEKRTSFAACYTNHGSRSAADFLEKCRAVLPDCPRAIQTDNGSEFALHFEKACNILHLERFHTHARSPKENAHVERFNRTLNEEFLIYHRALMRDDVSKFNDTLVDWLLWYNGERPHYALGQVSPFQAMMTSLTDRECQMWWTHTAC
jgi:transposase InsO family protein